MKALKRAGFVEIRMRGSHCYLYHSNIFYILFNQIFARRKQKF
ncbi:MAG: type II toxin-antitoxin system HicA family toxin [Halobacteriota archaeon]